jgi:hypothetical protein
MKNIYFSTFLQDMLLQRIISDTKMMDKIQSSNLTFTIYKTKKISICNIIISYFCILMNNNVDIILLLILNIINIFVNSINLNFIVK